VSRLHGIRDFLAQPMDAFPETTFPWYSFTMVRAVIFDLDNTLYPATSAMDELTARKMNEYVGRLLDVDPDAAYAMRREKMRTYGTTLEWLMAEHGPIDSDGYFSYVHPEGEEDLVEYDPELGPFLDSIKQPKYIFTNAPMPHADRVLAKLRVADRFERVFDVTFNDLKGKPSASAVDRVISAIGLPASETLFADDLPRYVRGFIDRGGIGVLVDHFGKHPDSGLPTIQTIYELKKFL
jgi:putative hydrolase of the HAD superfamily